ncbi:uncharacterized protein LOC112504613 [Cynara cardunculus var. scolymus]|uniref:uncharacterized protein LOC112504613 n=1 Tax=Cynara cardunculus var. scolymus TaxID=59895 RepID=UPI000D623B5E|nr:uncharacterized protein LOC112504613 [Cynara cardunculus var. scolymus]
MLDVLESEDRASKAIWNVATNGDPSIEVGYDNDGFCHQTSKDGKGTRHPMGVVRFGKKGKLSPRYIGPFEITARVGAVTYRLKLPKELGGIHDTFHLSNLRKCLAAESTVVDFEDIEVNDKLAYVEEPVDILDKKTKILRNKSIPLVLVKWKFHKGAEMTWETEEEMKAKYPQLF